MPVQSKKVKRLAEQAEDGEIPYISKSRVLKYKKCPRQFEYVYVKGWREEENTAMRRGTVIHEVLEDYYHNITDYVNETGGKPEVGTLVDFLPEFERWQPYVVPYIANFIIFEHRRLAEASTAEAFVPVEIEAERWIDDPLAKGDETAIPAMGYVDVIFTADSIPGVVQTDGVVIIDFKTGKTPDEEYRDDGIYLQGAYYALLFEGEYKVVGVGGYYPKNDDMIVSGRSKKRQADVAEIMSYIHDINEEERRGLETEEQPLCKWGEEDDEQCSFFDICPSSWGNGLKNADEFRWLVEMGYTDGELAGHFDCDFGAVRYTKYKLGLN
ncbi:PD-(D/E)XK nuclease family protein [Halocatena marina]|uniref:PD-(D/E)XK nuclease family protein n=1 Tax=Halocatena marina TaxID=2934937 RepID=A0ABD5YWM6_9EURY|nr:PD-(D/E)XK nuclease family protein [Halocatena marina]